MTIFLLEYTGKVSNDWQFLIDFELNRYHLLDLSEYQDLCPTTPILQLIILEIRCSEDTTEE